MILIVTIVATAIWLEGMYSWATFKPEEDEDDETKTE